MIRNEVYRKSESLWCSRLQFHLSSGFFPNFCFAIQYSKAFIFHDILIFLMPPWSASLFSAQSYLVIFYDYVQSFFLVCHRIRIVSLIVWFYNFCFDDDDDDWLTTRVVLCGHENRLHQLKQTACNPSKLYNLQTATQNSLKLVFEMICPIFIVQYASNDNNKNHI